MNVNSEKSEDSEDGFNVNDYWLKRGQTYAFERRTPSEYHRLQERVLLDVLKACEVPMERVLEIGCGFGRITKLLAQNWPKAQITAVDLSADQLANAQAYCTGQGNVNFQQYDFYSGQPFPGTGFDAAIAIEVFLHHPPEVVLRLMTELAGISKHIVNVDWSERWPWARPEHVWIHGYSELYAEAGLECARFLMPEKIDGKQQVMFIGAPRLSRHLLKLAEKWNGASDTKFCSANPASFDWTAQVHRAAEELVRVAPPGAKLILVDDAQWGPQSALKNRIVLPFLEKGDRYWGPPEDDAMAMKELERMRAQGANFIAFTWSCLWWLQHYSEFHRNLRERYRCCLQNERLIVFDLQT